MRATLLASLLLLAPAQVGNLQLKNVRATYGPLGVERTGTNLLPGDNLTIGFDIDGITVKDGKAQYALSTEILSNGKTQYRQPPKDQEATVPLGGNTLQGLAQFEIGLNTPPGAYEFKVTVTDSTTRQTQSFGRTYQVLPKGFGLVRLSTTLDANAEAPTSLVGVGHTLWVNFGAVGFERDRTSMQPNLTFEMHVLDSTGKALGGKPVVGVVDRDVPAMVAALPGQFPLPLNRAGKFVVEVRATDNLSKKTARAMLPVEVIAR